MMSTIPTAMPAFAPVPSPLESEVDAGCELVEVSVALFGDVGAAPEVAVEEAGAETRPVIVPSVGAGIVVDNPSVVISAALVTTSDALGGAPPIASPRSEDASATTEDATRAATTLVD